MRVFDLPSPVSNNVSRVFGLEAAKERESLAEGVQQANAEVTKDMSLPGR
jgi:hypothetical protein